jgi:YCII-related domain
MNRFMVLYVGPATPPNASHEGWPAWFDKLGDKLVDKGSPMADGRGLHGDGSTTGSTTHLNGYSIIQAKDIDDVLSFVKDHPYLTLGHEYSIEVYFLP